MEQVAFKMQTGFRPQRGTTDGLFAVMMGLKKRQEHGPESYGVNVDLAKSLGTVNRKALWEVLRKFGMRYQFVSMPARPHASAVINMKLSEEDTAVDSAIGVRQGA